MIQIAVNVPGQMNVCGQRLIVLTANWFYEVVVNANFVLSQQQPSCRQICLEGVHRPRVEVLFRSLKGKCVSKLALKRIQLSPGLCLTEVFSRL